MKLTQESHVRHRIRGYDAGEVRINDQSIRHNCLISADQLNPWHCSREMSTDTIQPILAMNPEVVILGLPDLRNLPNASIYAAFLERGIGFEVMDIGAACRTLNILLGEDRKVVAAMLLEKSN